ncbi:arginine-tRNA-protein transferase 1 [Rhizoctonia solani AG-1 IA]|uniref:Arginyl-tRNA--protein transferase 1 n=1 Tax=Thanatephorus cucumeris (strain AG1-IA) TaxID=983506 RepID=L8X9M7_THACA|nr:arginine-tRNA-protein transferase 1 [Rhizoctonia solani AG-1 IA]
MARGSEPITIVEIYGSQLSSCGYCTKKDGSRRPRTSHTVGMGPLQMSCSVYKRLLDRGWRRSGDYLYKPNLKESCCPSGYCLSAFVISYAPVKYPEGPAHSGSSRLDALEFKLSKSQRKALNKWNRFIIYGEDNVTAPSSKTPPSLIDLVHAADSVVLESQKRQPVHRLEVTLEPSSFTEEKYQLYVKYQQSIHEDTGNTPTGFERFLVTSAIHEEPIVYQNASTSTTYPLPTHYGSYHQMYRVDGELIAIGVIDILPGCVSSVYFMYAPEWNAWSLGKISAIREVTLAKEIHDGGLESMNSLYMVLSQESYTWHPLETCIPLLEKSEYSTFNESNSDKDAMSQQDMNQMQVVASIEGGKIKIASLESQESWNNSRSREQIEAVIKTFGNGLRDDIILSL